MQVHVPSSRRSRRAPAEPSLQQNPLTDPAVPQTGPAAHWQTFPELMSQMGTMQPLIGDRAFAGPRLAQAWARVLVMHWSRLERMGGLDLLQPLYVLDLAPDDGSLAAGMLNALRDEMHARGMLGWPVCYVLCPLAGEVADAVPGWLMQQPALKDFVARGWLDHASWQARTGHPLLLGAKRFALFGSRNPVVAVMAGGLSAIPSDLYAVHYGQLLHARVRALALAGEAGRFQLEYDWHAPAADDLQGAGATVLLNHYRASLISAAVLLSEPSLLMLDALADFSGGRYLLLATDHGLASEQQIRLKHMAPPEEAVQGQLQLPVNFHALGLHQESAGAHVTNLQWSEFDCILHLACRDDKTGLDKASWQSLVAVVDLAHPADRWWHGAAGGPVCSIEEMNFRLRSSGHDPWALAAMLNSLDLTQLEAFGSVSLAAIRSSLALTWQNMSQDQRIDSQLVLSGLLCHLGDWKLAREVLAHPMPDSMLTSAEQALLLLRYAQLEIATGRSASALQQVRQSLRTCPDDPAALDLHERLEERLAHWRASPWYKADDMREGDLSLELLDQMHVPAWLHQYRDVSIGCMTGLPPISSEEDAASFLALVAQTNDAEYAVMHHEHGFVGAVGVRCLEDMAHIHFWIGIDHQGKGLGARATQLLIRCLAKSRVRHVFTSVFCDNLRSRRILDKAGFRAISHDARGDDQGYLFMHLALQQAPGIGCAADELKQRLARMCECIGEPLAR